MRIERRTNFHGVGRVALDRGDASAGRAERISGREPDAAPSARDDRKLASSRRPSGMRRNSFRSCL
jgi:hypothetical protein